MKVFKLEPSASDSKIVSTPFLISPVNREDMKQRYLKLKRELEEKGILSND